MRLAFCIAVLLALASPVYAQPLALIVGGSGEDRIEAVGVDANGNVYVTGQFWGTNADFDPGKDVLNLSTTGSGDSDIFVASYTSTGAFRFAFSFGAPGTSLDIDPNIVVNPNGDFYVTGQFQGTANFHQTGNPVGERTSAGSRDIFLASYNTFGSLRFVHTFGSTGLDNGAGVALDGSGNVYLTGRFSGTVDFDPSQSTEDRTASGADDLFIASYTSTGAYRFAVNFGGAGENYSTSDIVIGPSGNIHIAGYCRTSIDFDPGPTDRTLTCNPQDDIFVASYTSAGDYRFGHVLQGIGNGFSRGLGIAVDANDNIFASGLWAGTVDFDPTASTDVRTAGGLFDGFLVSFSTTGASRFALTLGSNNTDWMTDVAVDALGNVYTGGSFRNLVNFDPLGTGNSITPQALEDAFVASYTNTGSLRFVNPLGGSGNGRVYGVTLDANANVYVAGYSSETVDVDPGPGTTILEAPISSGFDAFVVRYDNMGVLPVELTDFRGVFDDERVTLFWTTASETNNAGFEVQQADCATAADSCTWEVLGMVPGNGTSTVEHAYTYTTGRLSPATYRFRLRQIDYDGTSNFSPEVEMALEVTSAYRLSMPYPNPAATRATAQLSVAQSQAVRASLFDVLGREVDVVMDGRLAADETRVLRLPLARLAPGVYTLVVQAEGFTAKRAITVVQ